MFTLPAYLSSVLSPSTLTAVPPLVPREGGGSGMVLILQLAMIFGIFYFILIRPQRRQRQQHSEMLKSLVKGDKVMTSGGILGQIVHTDENELTIKTAENTRIVVDRGHIGQKISEESTAGPKSSTKKRR